MTTRIEDGRSRASRGVASARTRAIEFWSRLRRQPLMAAAFVFSLVSTFYWLAIASDRYVSEARVVVQKTDLAATAAPDLGALLLGDMTGNRSDQLMMREHLLSRDMMTKLEDQLSLEDHYSQWSIDPFSRLAFANSRNDLYEYYQDRVTVEFDEYAGVLVVRAQAFNPEMAEAMTTTMVEEGASFMNSSANQLAQEQVEFLRGQVDALEARAREARQAVISFQNRERIASPEAQAQTVATVIAQLEARKSELQVQLASQSAFLVDDHPILVELRRQIAAIDRQIATQNSRLAGPRGGTLNTTMEQFAILEADAKFAEELYRTALAALEKGQVESTRTIKTLSVIQQPNLPDEAELPDRLRNSLVTIILAFLIAGVLQLLVMIIRDHRD
ncbi:hypothetical protein [Sphingomicrobium clamense]|uniref:Chain-length determining protein n=1 Tax=Sphingomicrobium clamense TaxID=2851013 RepID=A0ABS6V333_9SPHN|nr:hypothetical protein [Sphingomicrobium sp. B8]MBW0143967.1 hypothetical protein [Sphingomicrobium sp. B8]